jgi:hypothetical protein
VLICEYVLYKISWKPRAYFHPMNYVYTIICILWHNNGNIMYHIKTVITHFHNLLRLKYIIFVVLYRCEIWCLNLKKDIDWKCLRTGCWGKYLEPSDRKHLESGENLHNEELHIFYSLDISRAPKSRMMRWEGRISHEGGKMRNTRTYGI